MKLEFLKNSLLVGREEAGVSRGQFDDKPVIWNDRRKALGLPYSLSIAFRISAGNLGMRAVGLEYIMIFLEQCNYPGRHLPFIGEFLGQ